MNKLSGWKRVSIVLTVTYIIAASIYSLSSHSKYFVSYVQVQPNEEELNQIMVTRKTSHTKCINDIDPSLEAEENSIEEFLCDYLWDGTPRNSYIKTPNYSGFVLVLVVFPITFWVLWLSILLVIKWVTVGFKQNA